MADRMHHAYLCTRTDVFFFVVTRTTLLTLYHQTRTIDSVCAAFLYQIQFSNINNMLGAQSTTQKKLV